MSLNLSFSYDGKYNVYTFPERLILYHGSSMLAANMILFPVGSSFQENLINSQYDITNTEERKQLAVSFANDRDISSILTSIGKPVPSFYADFDSALLYTTIPRPETESESILSKKCLGKCINAYRVKRNIKILVVNNVSNIVKILDIISTNVKELLSNQEFMEVLDTFGELKGINKIHDKLNALFQNFFFITDPVFENENLDPGKDFKKNLSSDPSNKRVKLYKNKVFVERNSYRDYDLPLTSLYCIIFKLSYEDYHVDGFGSDLIVKGDECNIFLYNKLVKKYEKAGLPLPEKHKIFDPEIHCRMMHPEFVMCNPLEVLERAYEDNRDWQYNNVKSDSSCIDKYMDELTKFKIANFKDYSGDVYETAIWTLLAYEKLSIYSDGKLESAPVALLANYVDTYTLFSDETVISTAGNDFLLDMNNFNTKYPYCVLISENLFYELESYLPTYDESTAKLNKVKTYIYLYYRNLLYNFFSDTFDSLLYTKLIEVIYYFMYVYNISDIYIYKIIKELLYIVLASHISKSSIFNFFTDDNLNPLLNNQEVGIVRSRRSLNINSRIYKFISNKSKLYPGEYYNKDSIAQMLLKINNFSLKEYDILSIRVKVTKLSLLISSINDYTLVLTELKEIYDIKSEIIDSALLYEPYVNNIAKFMLTHLPENKYTIRPMSGNKREDIIYILKIIKPILHIIFEQYSTKRYPSEEDTGKLPRINHNGLNHLRSVYFCAFVLLNTTFIEDKKLNSSELFLILLSSYFVSIGRINESTGDETIIMYKDFVHIFKVKGAYNIDYPYFQHQYISMAILNVVLKCVSQKFNIDETGKLKMQNILQIATMIPKILLKSSDATSENVKEIIDYCSIISIGHYFDHCRPTTSFSQLDTQILSDDDLGSNPSFDTARGAKWIQNFLIKFSSVKGARWEDLKLIYYPRIFETLKDSGYKSRESTIELVPMVTAIGNRCDKIFGHESADTFDYSNIFESLSKNFSDAWDIIFLSFFDKYYTESMGKWIKKS